MTPDVMLATITPADIGAAVIGCFFAASGVGIICFREATADMQIETARSLGLRLLVPGRTEAEQRAFVVSTFVVLGACFVVLGCGTVVLALTVLN
ncbi:MAG: hypothetical protein ABR975_00175 [Vulcanimicrobiaceae bacterium]